MYCSLKLVTCFITEHEFFLGLVHNFLTYLLAQSQQNARAPSRL